MQGTFGALSAINRRTARSIFDEIMAFGFALDQRRTRDRATVMRLETKNLFPNKSIEIIEVDFDNAGTPKNHHTPVSNQQAGITMFKGTWFSQESLATPHLWHPDRRGL